jgi:mannosyltransferase
MNDFVSRPRVDDSLPHATSVVAAICVVATGLCLWSIGTESIWFDEAYSVVLTDLNFSGLFDQLREGRETNMSLYYVMLKLWRGLVGDAPGSLRLLSAIATVMTIPLLFVLTRRLFDERVAVFTALLFALNGFVLEHSQTARGYTIAALLVTATAYCIVRAVEDDRLAWWLATVLAGVAAVHAHYFALPAVGALFASVMLLPRGRVPWRRLLTAAAVLLLLCAPTLAVTVGSAGSRTFEGTTPRLITSVVGSLAGGGGPILALAMALSVALGAFQWATTARQLGRSDATWRQGVPICWLFLPAAALLLVGLARPMLAPRFFFVLLPALTTVAAFGIVRLPKRSWQLGGVALLVLFSTFGVIRWHTSPPRQDWDRALEIMQGQGSAADAVVLYSPNGLIPYRVNRDGLPDNASVGAVAYPPASWDPLPLGENWPEPVSVLQSAAPSEGIWFVVWDDDGTRSPEIARIIEQIEQTHEVVPLPAVDGLDLRRYEPNQGP